MRYKMFSQQEMVLLNKGFKHNIKSKHALISIETAIRRLPTNKQNNTRCLNSDKTDAHLTSNKKVNINKSNHDIDDPRLASNVVTKLQSHNADKPKQINKAN